MVYSRFNINVEAKYQNVRVLIIINIDDLYTITAKIRIKRSVI